MRANASQKKSMSYGEMAKREPELKSAIDEWFDKAAAIDHDEDGRYGQDRQGDEMPTGFKINRSVWNEFGGRKRNWKRKLSGDAKKLCPILPGNAVLIDQ
jgi:hypothetical protein